MSVFESSHKMTVKEQEYYDLGFARGCEKSETKTTDNSKTGFVIDFPTPTDTFVRVKDTGAVGTIVCYQCVDEKSNKDNFIVMVSGYKEAWCGEYFF